jgi:probable F420-dependent oxidoreductase
MRFGLKTAPQDTTWADMLAVWQAADRIELFESAWTFDHFYPIFTDDITGPCLEGWVTTTALAQATQRLRVGVLVTGLPYRHPAVLANMAAALDIVSGGRLELGIGAGWNEVEARAYGIDLHPTLTERFDAFDEGCEAIIGLLTNESTTFDGRYVQLADARCNPKPVQRPHPPIWIGGESEPAMRRAAKLGDGWYPASSNPQNRLDTPARLGEAIKHFKATCEKTGRDPATVALAHVVLWPVNWSEEKAISGGRRTFTGSSADMIADAKALEAIGIQDVCVSFPAPKLDETLDRMTRFAEEVVKKAH